jgi:hypothetical protein
MGIKQVLSAPRSPWQRAYVERLIGSIRRECLDHFVVFGERTLTAYCAYYHNWRTHLSLGKDAPQSTRSRSQRPVACDQALSVPGISTAPDVELFEHPAAYQSADEKPYRSFTARVAKLLNYLKGQFLHSRTFSP